MMMNIANIHLENNTEIDQSTSSKKNGKKKKKTIKYQTCTLLNLKKLYHEIQKL